MSDLRQLRHFVALAEHGNFARAADAVHLSQPALSRSIQALEAQLDCRLLDRHSRGIALTTHGELVLEHAQRLLAGSRELKNAVSQLDNLEAGELRLGSGPYPAARLIPNAIGRMAKRYPRVRIKLQINNWLELRDLLLDDALELFVADSRELLDDPQLKVEPLRPYQGVIFCRPEHPLLQVAKPGLADLFEYPMASTQLPQEVRKALQAISVREEPLSIQCDNFMVLKTLVASSDVLSLAPWDVVAADVQAGRLACLPLPAVMMGYSAYALISRAGRSLSPAAQAIRTEILQDDQLFEAVSDGFPSP
ncbi:LysR family transcriptional regulator [Pseudomonas sp. TTU2014-080ASC]|uniref:LysR family transcriptional regulator n=1 Tax=Pseudomonas sp. TTU2014-080ASC TaxID=1729724 RepID=UPI000718901F|nr:LysR family transcriptional regulator [Pseudomonas sp. TTU2014-080ASC]KRW59416.1 LysR family transcriptional regulator [Pseudomonas sp. TTU2014-080ASC]